jgi:hypothetical protein
MQYPNLVWAIGRRRLAHYEIAAQVNMSESRFSRCLTGRAPFSTEERQRLASCLLYPVSWLFQTVSPPSRVCQWDADTELGLD